jgi:precorrin-2 methylase
LADTDGRHNAHAPVKKSRWNGWTRLISYVGHKVEERNTNNEQETPSDKATRVTATATKWMAIFTFVLMLITGGTLLILMSQLREMHEGGIDTHALAVSAGQQAVASGKQADATGKQAGNTKDLVDRMKDQTDQTKIIAAQALVLAQAAKVSADAARQQSITNTNQLELSQRPWVSANFAVYGPLVFDRDGGHINILVTIRNTGHSPAIRGHYDFKLYPTFLRVPDPVKERETMCANVEGVSALPRNLHSLQTFFVKDNMPLNVGLAINQEQINKAMIDIPESLFPNSHPSNKTWVKWVPIVLISCIAYRSTFTDRQYHTGYLLSLDRIDPKSGEIPKLVPTVGTSIPASELRLSYLFGTGTDAN